MVLDSKDQDDNMEDDGRPLGVSPEGSRLWVEKVQGCNGGGILITEMVLDEGFVMSRMSLEFPSGEDGEAVVTIGREVLDAMNGMYRQCMIVKVLGRHIMIASLNRKLRELWKLKGVWWCWICRGNSSCSDSIWRRII